VTTRDRALSLDALLLPQEPHGTFHDGQLRQLTVNYEDASYLLAFQLCVGDPDAADQAERERVRFGHLRLTQVLFWVCEPPDPIPVVPGGAAWLSSFGPLSKSPTETGRGLALLVPAEAEAWYLYFSDTNSFTYVAAKGHAFHWE